MVESLTELHKIRPNFPNIKNKWMIKVLRIELHGHSILKAFIIHLLLIIMMFQHIIFYWFLLKFWIKNDMLEHHYYQEQKNNKSFENREAMELYSQSFYHSLILDNGKVWPIFMQLGQTFHHLFFHV